MCVMCELFVCVVKVVCEVCVRGMFEVSCVCVVSCVCELCVRVCVNCVCVVKCVCELCVLCCL